MRRQYVERAQGVADERAEQGAAGQRERVGQQRPFVPAGSAFLVEAAADAVVEGERDEARPRQVLGDVAVGVVRRHVSGELVEAGVAAAEDQDGRAARDAERREEGAVEGAAYGRVEDQSLTVQAVAHRDVGVGDGEGRPLDTGQPLDHRAELAEGGGTVFGGVIGGRAQHGTAARSLRR